MPQVSTFISSYCILPVFPFVNANVCKYTCICGSVCILIFSYMKSSIINTILKLAFFFTLLYMLELILYQNRDNHIISKILCIY